MEIIIICLNTHSSQFRWLINTWTSEGWKLQLRLNGKNFTSLRFLRHEDSFMLKTLTTFFFSKWRSGRILYGYWIFPFFLSCVEKNFEFMHVDFSLSFLLSLLPMSLIILQNTRFIACWTFTFYGSLICIDGKHFSSLIWCGICQRFHWKPCISKFFLK